MYDPDFEHDACGVGFIAHIKGLKSHGIVSQGLQILKNLTHRGATGADPLAGDGAGILIQIPDAYFRQQCGFALPPAGQYGVGMIFLPKDGEERARCESVIAKHVEAEGQSVLGWRDVPTRNSGLGEGVKKAEPHIRQLFIGSHCQDQDGFERRLFVIRKSVEHAVNAFGLNDTFYIPSMS